MVEGETFVLGVAECDITFVVSYLINYPSNSYLVLTPT